ncbi:cupredoxin domain-containing protein [Phanerochaete sordida]|uniref:Cupredoxin domain-containing protein n=1 Tax=Phanerochaete sordida TaxID=48140 RepID=A0A9P3G2U3_9APHY|nr:cupredoxin domain-containing protein [Phanerochaete sordida]
MLSQLWNALILLALVPLAVANPGANTQNWLFGRQGANGGDAVGGNGGNGGSGNGGNGGSAVGGNGGFAGPGGSANGGAAVGGQGGSGGLGINGGDGGNGGDATGGNGGVAGPGGNADGGNATAGNGGDGGPNGQRGANGAAAQGAPGTVIGGGVSQFIVEVSADGSLSYDPSDIQVGDNTLVTFAFPQDVPHSVTESSSSSPCSPLTGGFDSGLTQGGTTFSVFVTNASTPVYFFCKAPGHCGAGMVGSINAPSSGSGSNAAFVAAAKAIGGSESNVPDNGPQTGGIGAVATAGPTSGTPTPSGFSITATFSGTESARNAAATSGASGAPSPSPSTTSEAAQGARFNMLSLVIAALLLPFAFVAY